MICEVKTPTALAHINALQRQIQDLKDEVNAEKRARQMAEEILATERLIWKRREEEWKQVASSLCP